MLTEEEFVLQRNLMVNEQLAARGIRDARVLAAMAEIPRHLFVPENMKNHAYEDRALQIGQCQTISQPYIVALMTEHLSLLGHEKVLEIGTGSGYQSAILSKLAKRVYTIERYDELSRQAVRIHQSIGLRNITACVGDGSLGLQEYAPYDAILVTAATPIVNRTWQGHLADGGCLLAPVGDSDRQVLELWKKDGNRLMHKRLLRVSFVPLRGEKGWSETEWRQ